MALDDLVEPESRGDPMCWTTKSTRTFSAGLCRNCFTVSHVTVAVLLHEMGYSHSRTRRRTKGASTRIVTPSSSI